MLKSRRLLAALAASAAFAATTISAVQAQEAKPAETAEPKPKTVIKNLDNPSGIAIHPATGHVFTASRYGIHRFVPGEKVAKLEVSGYPTDIYGKGPKYNIGPLGIAFLDNDHLVVGDGSRPDAEELVRIYKIPAEKPAKPQKEDEAAFTLGPLKAQEGVTEKGEGNYYGVAVGGGAIFVTSNGDDTKGWVVRVEVKDGKPGDGPPGDGQGDECPDGGSKPGQGSGPPKGTNPSQSPAQDSANAGGNSTGDVDQAKFKKLVADWGRLPPAEQRRALQELVQAMPPRHREAIVNYFQRLNDPVKGK